MLLEALARASGEPWQAPVRVFAETGSTNDDAKALAREGAAAGTLVIADAQTAGRGRSGARWHSPPGSNLYFSMVLRPAISPAAVAPFTLVTGLVVLHAVEKRTPRRAMLKWPNDVHVDGRKLAGILVEGQVRGDALASVVVGIGINVATTSFPPPLDRTATSFALLGAVERDRSALAADIAVGLRRAEARFVDAGFAAFVEEAALRDALRGRRVGVGDVRGVASGIDDSGRLLVARDDGTTTAVVAGHVELLTDG
jgi:BirA family biotin operon repressor/biotin-[acetyl-CoA-carboxylase] ligase